MNRGANHVQLDTGAKEKVCVLFTPILYIILVKELLIIMIKIDLLFSDFLQFQVLLTIHKTHVLSLTTVMRVLLNLKCVLLEHIKMRPDHVTLEIVTHVRQVISARTMVQTYLSHVLTEHIALTELSILNGARLVFTVRKLG